jgi:peptidyl-prolyl cis-trans isomerase C
MFFEKAIIILYVAVMAISVGMPYTLRAAEPKAGIVAVVNGVEIPVGDFYSELNRVQRAFVDTGRPLTSPQLVRLRTEVSEGLVRRELLYQESKKKVQVSEAEINAELKKLKGQYASETDFTNALNIMKMTPASLRAQVERALATQKLIETQFASKSIVSDQEIWAYYDRNRDSFRQPEQVRASHILIKVDPQWDTAKKAEARQKLAGIKSKIEQKQDFATLAKAGSEDTANASKGGDLGYIRMGQVLKPFEDALFALKVGEVSDIVETPLGYHLIKATERKTETTIPFEDLKDQLRVALKQEKGQQEAIAYIGKVRDIAKVEIFLPPEE